MENRLLENANPAARRRQVRPTQTKNLKVAIGILSFLLAAAIAGTCIFGLFTWNYVNELDIANTELTRTKEIVKDVVCESIVETDLGIKKPTNIVKTKDGGFIVSNDKMLVKVESFGDVSWNFTLDVNTTFTQAITSEVDGSLLVVVTTGEEEKLLKLDAKGKMVWSTNLPEDQNFTVEILSDSAGGCLIHGVSYNNDTTSYNSYFLKYDHLGKLIFSTPLPGFIAKSISYRNLQYYLVGEIYKEEIRGLAIYLLDTSGKCELLSKNIAASTAHGAFWNNTELIVWYNDAAGVAIYVVDDKGKEVKSKHLTDITRIQMCVAGKEGSVVCACEDEKGGLVQAIGPNLGLVWKNHVPSMAPKVLEKTVKGGYLAVFSEQNRNYDQRHQKYLEISQDGELLVVKEYKTKTAEIVAAVPYRETDIYAILAGPVFYGKQVDADTKAIIFPRKLDLDDMGYYC